MLIFKTLKLCVKVGFCVSLYAHCMENSRSATIDISVIT